MQVANEAESYEAIRSWLEQRCAIHYPEHKRDLLRQRLQRVQRAFGLPMLHDLARKVTLEQTHDVQLAVIHVASTNHTYFYREKDVLEFFRREVLPLLATRNEIRLWSAACSTGDEVYTLAIMIAETLGMDALRRTHILGTDISAPVIEQAETGVYSARHLEQVPSFIRQKYMRPVGIEQFQIVPEILAACTFRRMNLKTPDLPFRKPFQAVFCRNVLYYFAVEDQINVVNSIARVTEPGGWLFTSVTESVRDLSSLWTPVASGICVKSKGIA
nr:protein-glutamate O-methyltransferase CheR [Pseudotabrizicola algicola]